MKVGTLVKGNLLIVYGALAALVYLIAAIFYRNGPQVYSRTGRELFAWFCCLSLLPLFWKGYQEVNAAATPPLRTIVVFAIILCSLAFLIFPFHSTDVFGYINRGWQQVHYGLNPYVYRLADTPSWKQDPMLAPHWLYNPNPYGFLFSLLARVVCQIGNGHWLLTLALFKAVNVLAYAGVGWIIWLAGKRWPSTNRTSALYLFLWNPLILMDQIANGHNDLLTGLLVALAIYCAIVRREFWILPLLMLAGLFKFAPLVLLPLALIFTVKRAGWRTAILSGAVAVALAAAISFPYLRDWPTLKLVDIEDNATLIDNSLHSLLIHIFENLARVCKVIAPLHTAVNTAIKISLRAGFLCFLCYQYLRPPTDFTPRLFARKSLLILFLLICVASSKFNGWYLAMILPLALLSDEGDWLRELVVLISGAELLSLTFFKQAYMLNYFAMVVIPAWLVFRQHRKRSAVPNLATPREANLPGYDAVVS
jgi:alpha-1,6-mannosyltransferase